MEPVAANMGVVIPDDDFLPFLREITEENGTILIFDEVITGFRLGVGLALSRICLLSERLLAVECQWLSTEDVEIL